MHPTESQTRLISLLFVLARSDRPATLARLCRLTGRAAHEIAQDLAALDHAGLVHAERVRLSLQGLAVAVALTASTRGRYASAA